MTPLLGAIARRHCMTSLFIAAAQLAHHRLGAQRASGCLGPPARYWTAVAPLTQLRPAWGIGGRLRDQSVTLRFPRDRTGVSDGRQQQGCAVATRHRPYVHTRRPVLTPRVTEFMPHAQPTTSQRAFVLLEPWKPAVMRRTAAYIHTDCDATHRRRPRFVTAPRSAALHSECLRSLVRRGRWQAVVIVTT